MYNTPPAPGKRLGPYKIASQIGMGGMGEVYRATDTNLKRQVAIKVLPDAVATDSERLARFQREAEVLASLNHPNIAAIHGLERADGQSALVMEGRVLMAASNGKTLPGSLAASPFAERAERRRWAIGGEDLAGVGGEVVSVTEHPDLPFPLARRRTVFRAAP